jgi:hypothetical protein
LVVQSKPLVAKETRQNCPKQEFFFELRLVGAVFPIFEATSPSIEL